MLISKPSAYFKNFNFKDEGRRKNQKFFFPLIFLPSGGTKNENKNKNNKK
jgi:hypothetical protein